MRSVSVVILAAGGSSRLGSPKQLVVHEGKTLVEHAVQTALSISPIQVIVVLGSSSQEIEAVLAKTKTETVVNKDWQTGLASSIRVGIDRVTENAEGVIVMLVDQPLITGDHLKSLLAESGPIVATTFDGVLGVPALFERSRFDDLKLLEGDKGARDLIRRGPASAVEFVGASIDVDSKEDVETLRRMSTEKQG